MSEPSFFEQEDFDESKLKTALKKSQEANGPRRSFANEKVLESMGEQFEFEKEKQKIIDNLDWLKSMSVEEFTFRKKWEEVRENKLYLPECGRVKARIWTPTDLQDEAQTIKEIEKLQPKVIFVQTPEQLRVWNTLRIYCHSADYNAAPGRFLKFLVVDEPTDKILGFISIASDIISISCRDDHIGWTLDQRISTKDGRLNNSAICTTIAPTQPFGCNFIGGKLIAALATTQVIRDAWKTYGDTLVGLTTTSLYGPYSMYNGMGAWWKGTGSSKGRISIKPADECYDKWHQWLKQYNTEEYYRVMVQKEGISGPVTGYKLRILEQIFKCIDVRQSKYEHGYERGVYYSCLYQNSKEFFCHKIPEKMLIMKLLFKRDVEAVLEWWKPKAIERYKKLKAENRLNPEKLFYNLMPEMKYEEAKAKYFKDIGR